MRLNQAAYRGCLLGMAVGDAMGYPVDSLTLGEIRDNYGPNGLLGYDLVNGYADVTSYTQLAAFTCNGLLIAVTRGQMMGKMAPLVKYVGLSSREWLASQRPWERKERTFCWLLHRPDICRRFCMDTRMLDTLSRENLGTPETPVNNFTTPGGLTTAIGVGLFHHPDRMKQPELDRLGAETVALTHGGPLAFLSGAALAHLISRSLYAPQIPLGQLVLETAQMISAQFAHQYPAQCTELTTLLRLAVSMERDVSLNTWDVMEKFHCQSAAQVLAGAVYACMAGGEEFDAAMIIAVNHSGRSSAVGAIAGALLGLRLGEIALPEFYLECLEPADTLRELADDLWTGCPMEMGKRLFDADWDHKYIHGGK
ncbi:MAG: ADP-ribosylglycohydrolase family protein [Candidatus Faecousia sp.]|nr:ADP-ribosylglycohydrolase family protein [Candidatus Faecousia sp.]